MKKYNITVNGNTYEVIVEEAGEVASAPLYTAPVSAPAPAAAPKAVSAPASAAAPSPAAAPAPAASGSVSVSAPMHSLLFIVFDW